MQREERNSVFATPLNDAEFFVVDVETTGFSSANGGRIVEIGAVKLIGGAVIESFSTFLKSDAPISYGANRVHGISAAMLESAPMFSEITDKLLSMMNGTFLAAYNAPFDVGFLKMEFRLCNVQANYRAIVDVLPLARRMISNTKRYKLENVAQALNIPFPVQHRALEDTIVTAQILTSLCAMLKANGGTTVADLIHQQERSLVPMEISVLIQSALQRNKKLSFVYSSGYSGITAERIVTPQKFEEQFLIGFCHRANAERTFRIDRMKELIVME
jgi:DNA polymerase III epsilon subunit family exonuclease